jgi:hypothetical protein
MTKPNELESAMKLQILALIDAHPNIRTVEIADKLDMDVDSVRPLVADDIRRGDIVEEPITAPNGRVVQSFRMAWAKPVAAVAPALVIPTLSARIARSLPPAARDKPVAKVAPEPALPLIEPDAPNPMAEAVDIDVPVTRKPGASLLGKSKPKTKAAPRQRVNRTELAIECLRNANSVPMTMEFLRRAMLLADNCHPASYLTGAVNEGRIVCHNKMWRLGPKELEKMASEELSQMTGRVLVALDKADTAATVPAPVVIEAIEPAPSAIEQEIFDHMANPPVYETPKAITDGAPPMITEQNDNVQNTKSLVSDTKTSELVSGTNILGDDGKLIGYVGVVESPFVAGLMSNGVLEMRKDGKVMCLTQPEAQQFLAYFSKVAGAQWTTS